MHLHRENYLDVIRGYAILFVFLYHLNLNISNIALFTGGYLGVDIFFVLSGFLIVKTLIEKDRDIFSTIIKRARRLVPALIVAILIIIAISLVSFFPEQLVKISFSSIYSSLFISNFYFYRSLQIYGDDSNYLPLIHTWSLSAEFQIYLLIFFIFFATKNIKLFKKYIYFIFIFSFFLIIFYYSKILFTFYSPITRLFEFLIGSIIFLNLHKFKKTPVFVSNIIIFFSIISVLLLICYSKNPMPGLSNLIIVISAGLLILFNNSAFHKTGLFNNVLMSNLGRLSYSIYLYHFPVFLIVDNFFIDYAFIQLVFKIIITLILSLLSYYFIERPFNKKGNISNKQFFILTFFSFLVIILIGANIIKQNGYYNRLDNTIKKFTLQNFSDIRNIKQNNEFCHNRSGNYCFFENNKNNKTVYLYGDSHADSISRYLLEKLNIENINYKPITVGGTFPGLKYKKKNQDNQSKYEQITNAIKYFKNLKNQQIIIFARYNLYLHRSYFDNGEGGLEKKGVGKNFLNYPNYYIDFKNKKPLTKNIILKEFDIFLKQLLDKNNKVIIVYPTPELGFNLTNKVSKNNIFNFEKKIASAEKSKSFTTSYTEYKNRNYEIINYLNSIDHKNLKKIKTHELFCDKYVVDRCITILDGNLLYYDFDHLSYYGSKILVDEILNNIN